MENSVHPERSIHEMLKDTPSIDESHSAVHTGIEAMAFKSLPSNLPLRSNSSSGTPGTPSSPQNGVNANLIRSGTSKIDSIKNWSISTYKCTRQIMLEKLGKSHRTVDSELEAQIEQLRETQRKYLSVLRLTRALSSHFHHMVATQHALAEAFADLAQKTPELQEEFTCNSETQRSLTKNGELLLNALNFFISSVNTLCNKTIDDTLLTIRQYETASILALNVAGGYDSFICRLCRKAEGFFGAKAHAHICVTKAMKDDLQVKWNIGPATVLYDRAPLQFHPIDLDQKHELFVKLSKEYPQFLPKCHADLKESGVVESTALTQKLSDGSVLYKDDRPAVLISSTSWTPDEDFNTLLKALEEYEMCACQQSDKYPSILCIITGKGPQKELYMDRIAQLKWTKVNILTPWLDIGDYAGLLASADLGVCLHWSSSGLDLPMKVVDMFGSGLPVSAYNFNCLHELVVHGENGFVFESYRELADQLQYCFKHFPNNSTFLEDKKTFYRNLSQFQALRWTENWKVNAFPIFNSFI